MIKMLNDLEKNIKDCMYQNMFDAHNREIKIRKRMAMMCVLSVLVIIVGVIIYFSL